MAKKKEQPVSPIPTINTENIEPAFLDPIRYKTYSDKLKHPLWQRKRLEILQRDKWMCRECKATDIPLHIHHLHYVSGNEPWEADNKSLITLCEDCHSVETYNASMSYKTFGDAFSRHGAMSKDLFCIADYLNNKPHDSEWWKMMLLMLDDNKLEAYAKRRLKYFRENYKKQNG